MLFAFPKNSESHELLIILTCYVRVSFGDIAYVPFFGAEKREENKYAKEAKQREGLPDVSPPMLHNLY